MVSLRLFSWGESIAARDGGAHWMDMQWRWKWYAAIDL